VYVCPYNQQISPLPMYDQLRVSIHSQLPPSPDHPSNVTEQGHSVLVSLGDVATVEMLLHMYNIPTGKDQGVRRQQEYFKGRLPPQYLSLSALLVHGSLNK
jgi:hypothetical protein